MPKKKRGFMMKKMPAWWQRQSYTNRKEVFPSILRHQISRYLSKEITFERLYEWMITSPIETSGRSAVVARLLWEQKVAGSNPVAPMFQ